MQAMGRRLFPTAAARDTLRYRLCGALAGALNIHLLIAGNMVGYVVGLDDMWDAFRIYASRRGGWFVAASLCFMTAIAHLVGRLQYFDRGTCLIRVLSLGFLGHFTRLLCSPKAPPF